MRITILAVVMLSLMAAFVSAQNAPQIIGEAVYSCTGGCVEGGQGTWNISIQNLGQNAFNLQGLGLVDSDGYVFALKDFGNQMNSIGPNQVGRVTLQVTLPPPSRGSALFYKVNYIVDGAVYPDSSFRMATVSPLEEKEEKWDAESIAIVSMLSVIILLLLILIIVSSAKRK